MKRLTNILLIAAVSIFIFGSGYKLGELKGTKKTLLEGRGNILNQKSQSRDIDFSLFWDTWDKVEQKFIDKKKLDSQKMFYGAVKGMVATLEDPYTFFLTPEENKQTKDDLGGKFQGIGAQLGLKSNRIVIIAPLKNSPAQRAGVRAGDLIVKVDGQLTRNWTLPAAVSKIRGKKGTKVKLTLERKGKLIDVTIVRDEIIVDSIELSTEKEVDCKSVCPKVAYLKINQFGEKTNDEWDRAIAEVQKKWQAGEIKGLVLDVRDNPGGFLDGAVYLASEFLSRGQLVVKQESSVSQSRDYYSSRQGKLTDIPLVILINKGSASASEILSGALRDYNKATLVGEKSFGKGSVQEAIDLADGAGLHVTVAKWILPRGDWINGRGIEPQIKVENKTSNGNTLTRSNDLQLERAVEVILK